MNKMLDAEDLIIQKLKKEVEKLEKELTVLRNRHEAAVDNLDRNRAQVKELLDRANRFAQIERDFDALKRVLQQIALGEIEDPKAYAKKKLEDIL
jgi:dynactin complex subunit